MCENAMTTQTRDLMQITKQVRSSVEAGLPFTEQCLLCGICNMSITGRQLKTMSVVVGDNIRHDESALFDCPLGPHSFHLRCLKTVLKDELQNKKIPEILRCITCVPKSQHIQTAVVSVAPTDTDSDSNSSTVSSDIPRLQEI
jgi:hypothetical protein